MATNLALAGVNAGLNAIGLIAPVSSGLVGWWWPGTDQPTTQKNWALGGSPGAVAGAPTYGSGFASFKGFTNYLQTAVPETNDMTFFIVARSSDTFAANANRPVLFGLHATGAPDGAIAYCSGSSGAPQATFNFSAGYNNGTDVQETAVRGVINFSNFKYLWCRIDTANNAIKMVNQTDASSTTPVTTTGTRSLNTVNRVRVGSSYDTGINGTLDVAHFSVYSNAMSDANVALHYAFVQNYLASRFSFSV